VLFEVNGYSDFPFMCIEFLFDEVMPFLLYITLVIDINNEKHGAQSIKISWCFDVKAFDNSHNL